MSDLVKHEEHSIPEEILKSLTLSEKNVALATVGSPSNPKVKDLSPEQSAKVIDSVQMKASVMLGQKKKEGQEYEILSNALTRAMYTFPNLTVKEIYLATDNGLYGSYQKREDEPIIFTPANWVQWIKGYVEDTKRPVMKKNSQVYRKDEPETEPPSEYQSLTGRYRLLTDALVNQFENGQSYQDYGGVIYDLLLKVELIQPITENSQELKEAALWLLNNARDTKDRSKIKSAKETFSKISEGVFDESVLSVAIRKRVSKKLREICESGEDDVIEFLEVTKSKLEDYFNENSIERK